MYAYVVHKEKEISISYGATLTGGNVVRGN